jgi:membrane-associated HD superfamily phosphohydrolase
MDESTLEERLAGVDVSEDVTALTEGEDLSEEFKGKAATIFEAAVKSKLRSEVERIESAKTQEVAEEINRVRDELTEKVDAYMNYVVEEWMKENELAIERGLKGEIAEDFITGLKGLFEEHYIDVPDEKYDILEAQSEKIDELESKINEQIEKSASLKKENDQLVRESVFAKVSSDLADTEVEKFKSLAEDVDFNGEESFTEKLNTLKESYFPKATAIAESVDSETNGDDSNDTTGAMAAYMAAISKNVKRAK